MEASNQVRISVARLKGPGERFVVVGLKPESLALVFLWPVLSENDLRAKLSRRGLTLETINENIKNARARLPV